jgi:hypothetical protein
MESGDTNGKRGKRRENGAGKRAGKRGQTTINSESRMNAERTRQLKRGKAAFASLGTWFRASARNPRLSPMGVRGQRSRISSAVFEHPDIEGR